jgi:hypothetical protein
MKLGGALGCAVLAVALAATGAAGGVQTLSGVPGYEWYGGCGPTAAGMIIGYWDSHGFSNLIVAGDGTNSWATNRQAVKDMIASPGYFADYWPTPDRVPPPALHADDCVADFMYASRNPLDSGDSTAEWQLYGLTGYAAYRGYVGSTADIVLFPSLWNKLVSEINAGRPMEFFVDSTRDGQADHFVTVLGYNDDVPGSPQYAFRDPSVSPDTIQWSPFVPLAVDQPYGISEGTWFRPAPEPGTMALLGLGVVVGYVRRRARK